MLPLAGQERGSDSLLLPDLSPYDEALERGYLAGMGFMRRHRDLKADPRRVLPSARSVIMLALPYPLVPERLTAGHGLVASFSWGPDYHIRIGLLLESLCSLLKTLQPTAEHLAFVDSGPVLERWWAERAGLGRIGRNGALILDRTGPFCFLASVITSMELASDLPLRPLQAPGLGCGTCERCLRICPTGALKSSGVLDARRCISYLTIEHRGPIPLELRPLLGARLFGCESCLRACPGAEPIQPSLAPPLTDCVEILETPDPILRAGIEGSSLSRAGTRGLKRNAAVVLGNTGFGSPRLPEILSALGQAALHPSPIVSEHARWALGQLEVP